MKNRVTFEPILYLEGERVPFTSVTIEVQANAPSQMTVTVPPIPEFKNLLPRTLVHLFIRDPEQVTTEDMNRAKQSFRRRKGAELSEGDVKNLREQEEYRLFWEGEFVGWSYSKTPGQRSMVLTCLDLSNYWMTSYAYLFPDLLKDRFSPHIMHLSVGPDSNRRSAESSLNRQTIATTLENILRADPEFGIPVTFLDIFRSSQDLSEFFRLANRRLRISDVIPRDEGEEDSNQTRVNLPRDEFGQPIIPENGGRGKVIVLPDPESQQLFVTPPEQFFRSASGLAGMAAFIKGHNRSTATISQVVTRIMQLFYYQYWPVPAAAVVGDGDRASSSDAPGPVFGQEGYRLNNFIIKPSTFYSPPPACNVIFPDMISSFQTRRGHLEEPTRLALKAMPGLARLNRVLQTTTMAPDVLEEATNILIDGLNLSEGVLQDVSFSSSSSVQGQFDRVQAAQDLLELGFVAKDLPDGDTPSSRLYRTLIARSDLPLASREDYKGIIPADVDLPTQAFIASPTKGGKPNQRYLGQIAEYELWLAQHRSRNVVLTTAFNPYIVPGLPICVLDSEVPTFAEAASVSWTLSGETGIGTTQIMGSYARQEDVFRPLSFSDILNRSSELQAGSLEAEELLFKSMPFGRAPVRLMPFWLNLSYRPEVCGGFPDPNNEGAVTEEADIPSNKAEFLRARNSTVSTPFGGNTLKRKAAYPALLGTVPNTGDPERPMRSLLQSYTLDGVTHTPDKGPEKDFLGNPEDTEVPFTTSSDDDIDAPQTVEEFLDTDFDGYANNQRVAARILLRKMTALEESDKTPSRTEFMWDYVRRRMASMNQVFEYIGAFVQSFDVVVNDTDRGFKAVEELSVDDREFGKVGPFRKEHKAITSAIRQKITPGRVGDSSPTKGASVRVDS